MVYILDVSCVIVCECVWIIFLCLVVVFFFQAEDGIRDLVRSRGLGDVYKRQAPRRRSGAGKRYRSTTGTERPDSTYSRGCGILTLSLIHI